MEVGGVASIAMLEQRDSSPMRGPLPHCYTAHWVAQYRVRVLSYEIEQVEESVPSALGDMLRLSTEVMHVVVAVDVPQWPGAADCERSPALAVGESRRVWLSTTSVHCQRHTLVGIGQNQLDLCLHVAPLRVEGRGDENEATFLWRAEIALMQTGDIESHSLIKVQESAKGETWYVGEHRIVVKKLHAPLSQKDTSGETEEIRSEYPILILHVQVKVERISKEEAQENSWEALLN